MWRNFPVITARSPKAAEAAQCAGDQGRFWEYHDYLYESDGGIALDALKSAAIAIGLDSDQFNTCLDSGTHEDYVRSDQRLSVEAGIRGTPSFMVEGQIVANPTFAQLVNAVQAAQEAQ